MIKFIIDTSIVIKWVSSDREADVEAALELLRLLKKGEILLSAPSLLLIELINTLCWKHKLGNEELAAVVYRVTESGINFVDLLKDDLPEVLDLVLENKITSYDAVFLYHAVKAKAKLISADKQLLGINDWVVSSAQALDMLK